MPTLPSLFILLSLFFFLPQLWPGACEASDRAYIDRGACGYQRAHQGYASSELPGRGADEKSRKSLALPANRQGDAH
jgi:hypothetical protein